MNPGFPGEGLGLSLSECHLSSFFTVCLRHLSVARNQPVVSGRSDHASVSLWLCASVHVYESMCDYDCVHVCARTGIRVSVWRGSDGR